MSQQNIGVGTVPNDGTGDTLRTAFVKTQNNFSEFYSAFAPNTASNNATVANTLVFGNATINATMNSSSIMIGNTGSALYVNSTGVSVGNSTVNTFSNATHFYSGNSSVYSFGNSTVDVIANASGQTVITPISFSVGNSTANAFGNSTFESISNSTASISCTPATLVINSAAAILTVGNSTVNTTANSTGLFISTNTLSIGTSNLSTVSLANGYVHLPSGLVMMWGPLITVNTTPQVITYSTAVGATLTDNALSVQATSNNIATTVAVTVVNATAFTLVSNNATAQTAFWHVIGR